VFSAAEDTSNSYAS